MNEASTGFLFPPRRDAAELLRQLQRARHVLRGHHHDQRVNFFVLLQHGKRLGVAVGVRVANHVNRIAECRRCRQEGAEPGLGGRRQRNHFQSQRLGGVRRHDARTAGVGDDGHALAFGQRLHGERHRIIKERFKIFRADDASALERRAVGDVRARQTAGVRRRGLGARLGDTDFQNHDRLDGSRLFRDAQELVAFLDAFQITGNDPGFLVFGERLDEIHFIEVGLVAEADDFVQAEFLVGRPVENGPAQRAGLGDDGNLSGRRRGGPERGVHVMVRVEHAQTIRANHPHAALPADGDEFLFGLCALGADFAIAGGDDDDRFRAGFNRALEGVLHVFARHRDDAEVNLTLVIVERRAALEAEDFLPLPG